MSPLRVVVAVAIAFAALCCDSLAAGEPALRTEAWPNTVEGFDAFTQNVREHMYRNLLARRGVVVSTEGSISPANALTDGETGQRCEEGRVSVDGTPSVVNYYLGGLKPVREIRVFSFNGDTRANQDYEVRLADNSARPGQKPDFTSEPQLTTGAKILGADGGGFLTVFADPKGDMLATTPVDWVQFRFWRTYPSRAGDAGKAETRAQGWCSLIEVQVLGDPDDEVKPSPEVLARREALRQLPKQPPYEKLATWQETMQTAREAIVDWEAQFDAVLADDPDFLGATMGPWHVLGPLPADSPTLSKIAGSRRIAWDAPADPAQPLPWQACPDLKTSRMVDLAPRVLSREGQTAGAAAPSAAAGQVVLLARDIEIIMPADRNRPFVMSLGLGAGRARLLPTSHAVGPAASPAFPNQTLWPLNQGPGSYQLLVQLPIAADGSCRFFCTPLATRTDPGAGDTGRRVSRRDGLFSTVRRDFPDAVSQKQMDWEQADSIWTKIRKYAMAGRERLMTDWDPDAPLVLIEQYNEFANLRLEQLGNELATAPAALADRLRPWVEQTGAAELPAELQAARRRYYAIASVQDTLALNLEAQSLRLAVQDQQNEFGAAYSRAGEFLSRCDALAKAAEALWSQVLQGTGSDAVLAEIMTARAASEAAEEEILLANPLLDFEKLLLVQGGPGFASNWGGPCSLGNTIVSLSPPRPDGKIEPIYQLPSGSVSNVDVSFDGDKLLFSDARHIWEVNADGSQPRRISQQDDEHVKHFDPCYLPDGRIVFSSTACEQAVPCTGEWHVGNLHLMDRDGKNERRLTYDQDHDWNPVIRNDGRVLYTRWEYADTPHYFTRLLFNMNPDGTGQMEFYGSNSYWPNAMYWSRPIPGHPSQVVCIVSGHHGVSRVGEMILLDPAKGRHEADGVVQRIPGRGKPVEPVIVDGLVMDTWPRFAMPYPLAEPETNRAAGKYFLVNIKPTAWEPWGLYLVDVFDNVTPLLIGSYSQPYPLRPRVRPPVIPDRVDLASDEAVIYMADVYAGGGLRGYPRGTIKSLRVGSHHYRYGGNGDTAASAMQGGWDVKRILGTVPVREDGSALFRVPANTPVFVQPLDAEGKAQQVMRSWFSAMPGEVQSCVGCHEPQNAGPPSRYNLAANSRRPSSIEPWHGPARGFSFDREVQPLLDRRCVGCHNGQPYQVAGGASTTIDLRAKRLHPDFTGQYSPAYLEMQKYVRRAGFESDYHMHIPAEFEADTSALVQMLKKGHYNVQLTAEEWGRLYAWIDFNVPYPANWRESHRPPTDEQVARRAQYKRLHANLNDLDEQVEPLPPIAGFEPPQPLAARPAAPALEGWPLPADKVAQLQQTAAVAAKSPATRELDLGGGVSLPLVLIPAGRFVMGDVNGFDDETPPAAVTIEQPYYMGRFEVTTQQYAQFDPLHDNAYVEGRGKDRINRGTPIQDPEFPVVRITWNEAIAFCQWVSQRTGQAVTLPTEAQWEWACRAGTGGAFSAGPYSSGMSAFANIADSSVSGWNYGRSEPGYNDGVAFLAPVGNYAPNAWGLCDMHGNVAEWCLSSYRAYPYDAADGRNAPEPEGLKVVRGGSWLETLRYATSASRWRYQPYQAAYTVGFRVVVPAGNSEPLALAPATAQP